MDDTSSRPDVRRVAAGVGPPWPVLPRGEGPAPFARLPDALVSRGAISWYIGGAISLVWLVSVAQSVTTAAGSAASATAGITLTVVFGIAFLAVVPIGWGLAAPWRLVLVAGYLALSAALFPWLGWDVYGLWTYVGVALAMMVVGWGITTLGIVALSVGALFLGAWQEGWVEDILWNPLVILTVSMMMAAFASTFAAMNRLRAAQGELAQMAAERERGRVARDIHDILGHSLTVITVKAELAGRLVDADPQRARAEIGQVEELARAALADVRATVAGVRGVTLSGELAAARVALDAADIRAEIPGATDAVDVSCRELAAWVVREGVTNVVRHSHARRCTVQLGARTVEVCDDGVGPTVTDASSTGLSGLRERVEAAGGALAVGRSDMGGFRLAVTL